MHTGRDNLAITLVSLLMQSVAVALFVYTPYSERLSAACGQLQFGHARAFSPSFLGPVLAGGQPHATLYSSGNVHDEVAKLFAFCALQCCIGLFFDDKENCRQFS
jgi:hypothetical protein